MPPLETDCRFQDAVVQIAGTSVTDFDDDGTNQVAAAKQLKGGVRWEDVKREVIDPQGNNVATDAEVVVGESIPIKSVMWKGLLGSYTATVTKYRVVKTKETPDLKNREVRRIVFLKKLGDTAPSST